MTRKEFIDEINNSKYLCLHYVNDEFGDQVNRVKSGKDLDEHRRYSIATNIYECEDGFACVRGAYQSFSEMQTWLDIDEMCYAFPVKQIITYDYVEEYG